MRSARFVRSSPSLGFLPFAGLILASVVFAGATASAQTVRDIANGGACSTAGIEGLSAQLVELHLCMFPDQVVEIVNPNITTTSDRVHLLVTTQTRDALEGAAAQIPLRVNSGFRTLADQYTLYSSGGCGVVAKPGTSNHQSGLAVDLANWSEVVGVMGANGCAHPLPNTDAVHFDCPGPDMRGASTMVFQRLWNVNNPGDPIAEDGDYGPQTAARVAASPANGFPTNGCDSLDDGAPPADMTIPPPSVDGEKLDSASPVPDTHEVEGGCSVSGPAASGSSNLWLALGLGILLRRRSRSRA